MGKNSEEEKRVGCRDKHLCWQPLLPWFYGWKGGGGLWWKKGLGHTWCLSIRLCSTGRFLFVFLWHLVCLWILPKVLIGVVVALAAYHYKSVGLAGFSFSSLRFRVM